MKVIINRYKTINLDNFDELCLRSVRGFYGLYEISAIRYGYNKPNNIELSLISSENESKLDDLYEDLNKAWIKGEKEFNISDYWYKKGSLYVSRTIRE